MSIIPQKLKIGDTIGIVAPSKPIVGETEERVRKGIKKFEEMGFKVKVGNNVFKNTLRYSTTPEEKAEDINAMFKDKEVKAIMSACGGANSFTVLPLINYDIIKNNPKIIYGISDATNYLNAIYAKTGLITFHQSEATCNGFEEEDFILRLVEGKIGKLNKKSEWSCIQKGITEGIVVGANLPSMCNIVNTEFMPELENKILLLEAYRSSTNFDLIDNYVARLQYFGVFDKIKGLIIGHYAGDNEDLKVEDVFFNRLKGYNFPILKCENIGHNCENVVIPIGGKIKLDATNCEIELMENIVE